MKGLVYLLDQDTTTARQIALFLKEEGIICRCFRTVREYTVALREKQPNVVLTEWLLPDGNGLDVVRNLMESMPSIYRVFLSGRDGEEDVISALEHGADDYIIKPFSLGEFFARIKAFLRRSQTQRLLKFEDIQMDCNAMVVKKGEEELKLNRKEYDLLKYLLEHPQTVVVREQLLSEVWGYIGGFSKTRTLDNHIARLRKMGIEIETIFGVGYLLKGKE